MYEQVVDNVGYKPKEISADCGYDSNENYVYIKEEGINAYLPDQMMKAETDEERKEKIFIYAQLVRNLVTKWVMRRMQRNMMYIKVMNVINVSIRESVQKQKQER